MRKLSWLLFGLLACLAVACGGNEPEAEVVLLESEPVSAVEQDPASEVTQSDIPFVISAVPDQEPELLREKYEALAAYLAAELNVPVVYKPLDDHTAVVNAFASGEVDMVWIDGLHGVQARLRVDRSQAILQRPSDQTTTTVFVASSESGIDPLDDASGMDAIDSLAGRTVAFGADPLELLESGTNDLALLDARQWDALVASGDIDSDKLVAVFRTPPHHSKHWLLNPSVVERYGVHFPQRVTEMMMSLDPAVEAEANVLELFNTDGFIFTDNSNYDDVEQLGRGIGFIVDQ